MTPLALPAAAALLALAAPATPPGAGREVRPAGPGPQRLELDAAALLASARPDLGDLRLVDAAGAEVPYLLVEPQAPAGRWVQARVLPLPISKAESGLEADLGAVRPVEELRLSGVPEPFLKRFRLEGSGDRVRWTVLVPEGTVFALPAEELRRLSIAFPRGEYRYLRLVLDDRQSARLPLPGRVEAFVPEAGPRAPAPVRVPLGVERRASEPGVSRFALALPGPRLPVRAVVLQVRGERLLRPATIREARLGQGRLAPVVLGEATLRRVVTAGVGAEALRVPVAPPEEAALELEVDDGDNPPLELAGAEAELAPLPWLYFESRDGAPLFLQAGARERRPPRYDLEAVRAALVRLATRPAQVGPAPEVPAGRAPGPGTVAAARAAPGAPLDPRPFRVTREIAAGPAGLSAVRLDAAVLGRSQGLADLRIAGPDGNQIPYLLEERPEPLVVPLAPDRGPRPPRPGVTAWTLALPEESLPAARLVLETDARVFVRRVRVLADRPAAEGGPAPLGEGDWSHAAPERPAPAFSLALPPVRTRALIVEVDDGDNAPIAVAAARVLLPSWRLRFLHPGPALRLLYDAPGTEAPRYDLALLAPQLRAAPAAEVALGPAPAARAAWLEWRPATAAWAALVLGVLVLAVLLARLLRAPSGP